MLIWLQALLGRNGQNSASASDAPGHGTEQRPGMITRTCRLCGKTFTLPEAVQHWPDCCQECRAKHRPAETVTRTCQGCGRSFTFDSSVRRWPKYCRDCQARRAR